MVDPAPQETRTELETGVLETIIQMVKDVESVVPPYMELVVHDFAKLPTSVVAIAGNITGRTIGSPATNVLLREYARDELGRYALAYQSTLPDGRVLNCSSVLIKADGKSVGVLCINVDTSVFADAARALSNVFSSIGVPASAATPIAGASRDIPATSLTLEGDLRGRSNVELYPQTIDDLVAELIDSSVARIGIPVELMRKEHKKAVVSDLQDRGTFVVKNSVDAVAAALQVTRFTVYNYLNELEGEGAPPAE
jgi:predicted transcriptional regulator YheO